MDIFLELNVFGVCSIVQSHSNFLSKGSGKPLSCILEANDSKWTINIPVFSNLLRITTDFFNI